MKPLILVNFKTYPEATGKKAVELARKIAAVNSRKYHVAIAPPLLELEHVCKAVKILVFAQHVDSSGSGAHTGEITAKDVKKLGAGGTLLNHSERKLSFLILKNTIKEGQRNKLVIVACAGTLAEVQKIAALHPEYIAYEPPELIGGKVSVTAEPEILLKAVRLVKTISPTTKMLCGAGIHSREDLLTALQLGMKGVLLSHAVVKAHNPKRFLEKMMR